MCILLYEIGANFIKKVRESRFIKVRDRQVSKFNRLMGKDKDRELTTQPPANTMQLLSQSNSNKWVINLCSMPLSQSQESLLSKGPNCAVSPKNPPHRIYYLYRINLPEVRPSRS